MVSSVESSLQVKPLVKLIGITFSYTSKSVRSRVLNSESAACASQVGEPGPTGDDRKQ